MRVWHLLLIMLLSPSLWLAAYFSTQTTVTVTVTEKERVDGTYLVFTDLETLKNEDDLLFFKFNSSDLYGSLKEGQTYDFRVAGWRVPLLSWYRNVVAIEPSD